jgi:hypothetical protein
MHWIPNFHKVFFHYFYTNFEFSLTFFCLFFSFAVALSLHLQKVIIPQYKFRGETAILECDYELNGNNHDSDDDNNNENLNYNFFHQNSEVETLYSVKWYKDGEEFYRYRPKSKPPRNLYKGKNFQINDNHHHLIDKLYT